MDVFSEWLDDCEAAERGEVAPAAPSNSRNNRPNMNRVVHDTSQDYSDEESDGLPEPSGLGLNKRPAEREKGSDDEEGGGGGGKKQKATTATLGLDESDDDSE